MHLKINLLSGQRSSGRAWEGQAGGDLGTRGSQVHEGEHVFIKAFKCSQLDFLPRTPIFYQFMSIFHLSIFD